MQEYLTFFPSAQSQIAQNWGGKGKKSYDEGKKQGDGPQNGGDIVKKITIFRKIPLLRPQNGQKGEKEKQGGQNPGEKRQKKGKMLPLTGRERGITIKS